MIRGYNETKEKNQRVNEFLNLLKEKNIKYNETNITNIVEVIYKGNVVLLSLRPSREFKTVKIKINNKWTRKIISKLINEL